MDAQSWVDLRTQLRVAVWRLSPAYLRGDVDDLVQDGMLRLVRHDGSTNASYVWRVAWSVVQDAARRQRRKPEHGPDALETTPDRTFVSPEQHASDAQVRVHLNACLELTPETRRDLLTLYLLGHPLRECADLLGVPPKSAENAIYRGMESLRRCLESKGVAR